SDRGSEPRRADLCRQADPLRRGDRGCRGVPDDAARGTEDAMRGDRRRFLAGSARLPLRARLLPLLRAGPGNAAPGLTQGAVGQMVGDGELRRGKVKLEVPPLVENGNTVPLTVSVESPMSEADHVRAIHIFNEKNPQPYVISMALGPRAGRARVATRIKLAD